MADEKRLIDANKLMEHLTRCINTEKGLFRAVCVAIKCFVEQMPTVDAVEVVHGRWIKVHEWCGVEVYRCSACGREHPRLKTAYCCDCGAKMNGGNEDG